MINKTIVQTKYSILANATFFLYRTKKKKFGILADFGVDIDDTAFAELVVKFSFSLKLCV